MPTLSLKFFKDILMYTGGSFIGRLATLFLLPLTTSYLTPADYGVIAILTLIPILMNGFSSLGFHTSLGRVYASGKDDKQKEGIIWTAFCALLFHNLVVTVLAVIFSKFLSLILLGSEIYRESVCITFVGVGICTIRMAFEYYLRAAGKVKTVFALNLCDVFLSIATMLLEVVYFERGAKGYMEAFAIAQSFNLILVLAVVGTKLKFSLQKPFLKDLLVIGIPCIYGYWGYCILQGSSRYLLQMLSTEEQVGLYFLGSNLGRVIELPLWGFMSAWVPLFNSYIDKKEEAPFIFKKVMTYYLIGMGSIVAALFCFARPISSQFLQPPFRDVWTVIGLTGMAQALWGAYAISYPPLIFYKKTGLQAALEMGAAFFCICANAILIPLWHKEGAALATLVGFLVLILASIKCNQKLLFVPYERKRILKLALALAVISGISFIPIRQLSSYTALMAINFISFCFYIWIFVLDDVEKATVKKNMSRHLKLKFSKKIEV
jgi:O-antigen/teichoic acid export membrane protein